MGEQRLAAVRIVLVEPAGARNVGAIARVMKNMGIEQLVLVNPQCDRLSKEARDMAVHAADILESALEVPTLPQALQGCKRAIATTARPRTIPTELESPRSTLPWLLEEPEPSALIFGPEYRGLSNVELNYAQRFVFIQANPEYPSLNLATAVAICCYELYQYAHQLRFQSPSETSPAPPMSPEAPLEVLEEYYQQLEAVLLKIGYLYPHTAASRMEKFRRLFHRASLTETEVGMLRGILSQMEWALKSLPHQEKQ
ncbi:RNA methyltransferase [Microcoleus sp. FACHB-831]|uniref:RNA methyltransferase n=1 Tax=Microcoleus sp. FACHB-831 TaxID=2692827 RepID=UPI001687156A|nr:RNA methyltransferase [Microcoleus sp. FACHB-831]MBD1922931.1 RNA methyltransferase [Microcoleus sp. FACHB-831]